MQLPELARMDGASLQLAMNSMTLNVILRGADKRRSVPIARDKASSIYRVVAPDGRVLIEG